MNIQDFMVCIKNGQIPPSPPDGTTRSGNILNYDSEMWTLFLEARNECTEKGMWLIVDKIWTKILANWIKGRKIVEVMAGGGWVAKALSEHGVSIIATDNFSWIKHQHNNMVPVYPVKKVEAVRAAKTILAEVLLVSWPPYGDNRIVKVCEAWGSDRPIIYIGETGGGCNAPEEFFDNLQLIEVIPDIPLMSWYGIHDTILIGRYIRKELA